MSDDFFERWLADFDKRADAFANRKIHTRLTPEILATIPDDELEQAIFDYVHQKVADRWDEKARMVKEMADGIRAVHATWAVDAEVQNGGFNQFFWNESRDYAADAVAGFTLFELPQLARLMQEAIDLHRTESARLASFRERGSLQAVSESYNDNPLNDLDKKYYDAAKDLSATRIAFIRKHPGLFTGE